MLKSVLKSAMTASLGEFHQFKAGHQLSAWLGVVPSQNSSGGKASLGRITKRGDDYLRTLMIQGAKSVVMSAAKRVKGRRIFPSRGRSNFPTRLRCVVVV